MPSRTAAVALGVGLAHAVGLLALAGHLGYAVGPANHSAVGTAWRYGGLVAVAALPVRLADRYRLVAPVVAVALVTGHVVGMELAPPGPTFRDVAELERLGEPTGVTVVEDGLHIVRYMTHATVWSLGILLLGLVEGVVRTEWRLPPPRDPPAWLSAPATRESAAVVAAGGGLLHAAVMTWFAARLGVALSGTRWPLYAFGAAGMWVVAAVPLYLLVWRRLVAPAALLAAVVLWDAHTELRPGVESPHALYFGGWVVPLAVLLVVAAVEWWLR